MMWSILPVGLTLVLFYFLFVLIKGSNYKKTFFKIDVNEKIFSVIFIGCWAYRKRTRYLTKKNLSKCDGKKKNAGENIV